MNVNVAEPQTEKRANNLDSLLRAWIASSIVTDSNTGHKSVISSNKEPLLAVQPIPSTKIGQKSDQAVKPCASVNGIKAASSASPAAKRARADGKVDAFSSADSIDNAKRPLQNDSASHVESSPRKSSACTQMTLYANNANNSSKNVASTSKNRSRSTSSSTAEGGDLNLPNLERSLEILAATSVRTNEDELEPQQSQSTLSLISPGW